MVLGLPDGRKDSDRINARMRKTLLPTPQKDSARRAKLEGKFEKRNKLRMGRVFRYTHMPEFFPRLHQIGEKLGHFAYMLALVFRSARLLPENHPMLNPANVGRFGLTDVIATAANNLVLKRENMDQILIFGAVVSAMLMIAIQAFLIAVTAVLGNSAQAADSSSMFTTPNPQSDVVTQFLGQVFGFKTIFASPGTVDQPGLYAILGFYSTAMMVIAVLIVVYYVITVVGESAQSGQPFGKRFNGLWAPIRLVLALGLLVPLGGGINAAQYLTLYVAKFGSGLATQGWMTFTKNFAKPEAIVGTLSAPSSQGLASAIFTAEACRAAYNQAHFGAGAGSARNAMRIRVNAGNRSQAATFGPADIQFGRNAGVITYVWTTDSLSGAANSTCGSLEMKLATSMEGVQANGQIQMTNDIASRLQGAYLSSIKTMIEGISGSITTTGRTSLTQKYVDQTMLLNSSEEDPDAYMNATASTTRDEVINGLARQMDAMQTATNAALQSTKDSLSNNNAVDDIQTKMRTDAEQKGWGTAGVYYLEIAKFTQLVLDAVSDATPKAGSDPVNNFNSGLGAWLAGESGTNKQIATAIRNVPSTIAAAVGKTDIQPASSNRNEEFMNKGFQLTDPLTWIAKMLFGKSFFLLLDTPTLNPMQALINGGADILFRVKVFLGIFVVTQLSGSILGMAATGVATGLIGAASTGPAALMGGMVGLIGGPIIAGVIASILKAAAALCWFLMMLGAAVGIVLFYLLPLLPFMYFFFSVVNWVIEVAEAFVSMPLFALSHLRIDGEGLLPQRAFENWLILFGIMLRPLMIVVGMIIGSLIFNAGAFYLASIYKYAIFAYNNAPATGLLGTGFMASGGAQLTSTGLDFSKVSGFGIVTYLILYVYMIYLLATSSFKLIDQVPDKMLRWIGGPTPFTGDRPVDLQGMQSMALLGYGALKGVGEVKNAMGGNFNEFAKTMADAKKLPKKGGGGGG